MSAPKLALEVRMFGLVAKISASTGSPPRTLFSASIIANDHDDPLDELLSLKAFKKMQKPPSKPELKEYLCQ